MSIISNMFAGANYAATQTLSGVLALCAPQCCAVCNENIEGYAELSAICRKCLDNLPPPPESGEALNKLMAAIPNNELSFGNVYALTTLSDVSGIAPAIYGLKYFGQSLIAEELGRELGETLRFRGMPSWDALIPVPIHSARRRERGYNQSEHIAKGIASAVQLPIKTQALIRTKYTTTQTKLTASERKENVVRAFVPGKQSTEIKAKHVALVDDIVTTGSTVNACASALLHLGARRVDVVALAITA